MNKTSWLVVGLFFFLTSTSHAALAVAEVKQISFDHYLRFTGIVEAVNQGTASAQTSGRVEETQVDVGDLVQKNDVILRLRDTQQQANFQSAQAGVKAAQAQFDSAEKEYVRVKEVRERKLVAQSVLDNALAARDSAKAALQAAQARQQDAEEQLEFTRVRAPYSGIVLERHIEVGELVSPGTPLYTGMSLERLRVVADVPQKDIVAIRQYQKARIEIPSNESQSIIVTEDDLTFFGYADPTTSTFKIRAYLPAQTEALYPGMYLPTHFKVGVQEALVVPKHSVVYRGEVTAVYVQREGVISMRQIKVGREYDDAGNAVLEILSGLQQGEQVILEPTTAVALIKSQVSSESE